MNEVKPGMLVRFKHNGSKYWSNKTCVFGWGSMESYEPAQVFSRYGDPIWVSMIEGLKRICFDTHDSFMLIVRDGQYVKGIDPDKGFLYFDALNFDLVPATEDSCRL